MAEALGDRAGVTAACANLANCYYSTGDYGRAREMQSPLLVMRSQPATALTQPTAHGSGRDGTIKTLLSWGDAPTNRAQKIIVLA
jgi:hypothetical protein